MFDEAGIPQITGSLGGNLLIAAAWALGTFVLGYSLFMTHKHKYADLV